VLSWPVAAETPQTAAHSKRYGPRNYHAKSAWFTNVGKRADDEAADTSDLTVHRAIDEYVAHCERRGDRWIDMTRTNLGLTPSWH
jgi:hypothetical protein